MWLRVQITRATCRFEVLYDSLMSHSDEMSACFYLDLKASVSGIQLSREFEFLECGWNNAFKTRKKYYLHLKTWDWWRKKRKVDLKNRSKGASCHKSKQKRLYNKLCPIFEKISGIIFVWKVGLPLIILDFYGCLLFQVTFVFLCISEKNKIKLFNYILLVKNIFMSNIK